MKVIFNVDVDICRRVPLMTCFINDAGNPAISSREARGGCGWQRIAKQAPEKVMKIMHGGGGPGGANYRGRQTNSTKRDNSHRRPTLCLYFSYFVHESQFFSALSKPPAQPTLGYDGISSHVGCLFIFPRVCFSLQTHGFTRYGSSPSVHTST